MQWIDGKLRSNYPIGTSVLAMPIYLAGMILTGDHSSDGTADALSRLAADLLTLAAGIMLQQLSYRPLGGPLSVLFALAIGLGTPCWSICSDDLWQHTGCVLSSSAALLLLGWDSPRTLGRSAAAGLALGYAVTCRPTSALFLLLGGAWLLVRAPAEAAALCLGATAGAAPGVLNNLLCFGDLRGGYHVISQQVGWDWPSAAVLLKLLCYPSRGLLLYAPVTALAVPGIINALRQRGSPLLQFALICTAAHFTLISSWRIWDGGVNFGPRLLTDTIPFIAVLMIPAFEVIKRQRRALWFIGPLIALSVAIQGLGAFMYDGTYIYRDGGRWDSSELRYVITRGQNEIIWPSSPDCVRVGSQLDLRSPDSAPHRVLGFAPTGMEPISVLAMSPVEPLSGHGQLDVLIHDRDGDSSVTLLVTVDGQLMQTTGPLPQGKPIAISFPLPGQLLPDTVHTIRFKFKIARSPAFNFVHECNTVRCPVAVPYRLTFSRDWPLAD